MTTRLAQLVAEARNRAVAPPAAASTAVMDRLAGKATVSEINQYAEIKRIVALPLVQTMTEEEHQQYCKENIQAKAYAEGFRLLKTQSEAVSSFKIYTGAFIKVGVGFGKTLISLMIAEKAWSSGCTKMLLLVPSQVMSQLVEHDIAWARLRVSITYPIHVLGGREMPVRRSLAASGRKGLYIMPYSLLSTKDTSENLEKIKPKLIIADEGHNLAKRSAARTRRVMDYVSDHKPRGVVLSGTITSKSIKDYYHLIRWCLGDNNPLPNSVTLANDWAAVIDADSDGPRDASGPLTPLVDWARRRFPDQSFGEDLPSFRRAFKLRLSTAPGVVSTGDEELGTSLILGNTPVAGFESAVGWSSLEALIKQVQDLWLTPNGDEIEHAIHTWKWMNELSAGFYNELVWPTEEILASRRNIAVPEAASLLKRAKEHHAAGQEYAKELRGWLEDKSKPGVDTPMLVGNDMSQHGDKNVGAKLYGLWQIWKGLDFEHRPERDARAVRVCSYKIDAAVAWAKALPDAEGALLWVYHQEIGEWLYEACKTAGLKDCIHCPAGEASNDAIRDEDNADKIVVASITAHGTGKNLQHFQNQRFIQWPRQAVAAEQTIGRTHRYGQKADELIVNTCLTTEFDELNFAACLNDSLYIHQTTDNRQKLIYATYDPMPRIFPAAVLLERGMQNKMLNKEQQKMLQEKFT